MPYTLNFSDPGNLKTITVPDYPPGLNAVDTSLSFIGKSYPNYGQVIDQNFLKLLENFAGPLQPSSPVKGQLWYDSFSRTLKLFDGNAWKAANGIYQQPTDPAITSPVSFGDIWVDTANSLLKIRGAGTWIQIGPSESEGTGLTTEVLDDVSNISTQHTVLVLKVNSNVVAVFNSDDTFTPANYPAGFQGFTEIAKGITLPETTPVNFLIKGTTENSLKLEGINGSNYLRKEDTSAGGQLITGKVVFVTPATSGQENRDGIIIRTAGDNPALNFIQFFKKNNDAILSNEVKGGKLIIKIKGLNDTNQTDAVTVEKNQITVQGNFTVNSGIISASTITGTLLSASQPNITSVGTLNSLSVTNSIVCKDIESTGTTTLVDLHVTGRAVLPPIYGPGTVSLWAGSTSTTAVPNGWLVCDGSTKSTATYSLLYSVLGNLYGIASGGNFYLPNLVLNSPLPPGDPRGATTSTYYIIKQD